MTENCNFRTSMLHYADKHDMFNADSKVLVAVSGGIDSMVMLHLLHDAGIKIVVAHCNFRLRGKESDADQAFVKAETAKLGIEIRTTNFDTELFASTHSISTQMAARELRYKWFGSLLENEGFDAIVIAHNRDDNIETLLINLARGTGIRGLTGIKPKNGKIIRPLLFASRIEIEAYAKLHGINFREDSSNATDNYARNYFRHHIIPGMEQFFPGMRQAVIRAIEHFSAVEIFYDEAITRYRNEIVESKDDLTYIDLTMLQKSPSPPVLLYEILKNYGFSNAIAYEILDKNGSGRQFFSDNYRLVCHRQKLVIQKKDAKPETEYLIDEHILSVQSPIRLKIEKFEIYDGFTPDANPNIACLDGDKLEYPLLLRKWKYGDSFRPLGMKNMKKLSDFFIDEKLSIIEKERCHVMLSGRKIVWIAGLRIDDRFKITKKTKKIVKFVLEKF